MNQDSELKPCPFCRAPAELEQGSDHHGAWFNLGCSRHWGHQRNPDHTNTCIAGRIFYTETEMPLSDAIAVWNTRAASQQDKLIEAAYGEHGWRRREMQRIGAAISTRNWPALEQAYNELRDKMDRAALASEEAPSA